MLRQWYLGRGSETHGPYTWEEITGFARDGNIGKNDLLWSPSGKDWVKGDQVPGLFAAHHGDVPAEELGLTKVTSESTLFRGSREKRALIAGGALGGAFLGVLLVILFTIFSGPQVPDIEDHFPQKGAEGSPVFLLLEESIEEELIKDLQAFYNDEEIAIIDAFEDIVQVKAPRGAPGGKIKLQVGRSSSNTVEFAVAEEKNTPLHSETLEPAEEEQTITCNDQVSVTVPAGVLDEPRELSISAVENAPPNDINPLDRNAVDISIEGLEQLDGYIEIGLEYDPESIDPGYDHEKQLMAARWDDSTGQWIQLPYRVDEDNHIIYMATDHLSRFSAFRNFVKIPTAGAAAKTSALAVGVVAAPAVGAWAAERVMFSTYTTPEGNFVLHYHRDNMDRFVEGGLDEWERPEKAARYNNDDEDYPQYIRDIGAMMEKAYSNYTERGFEDPVVEPGWVYGESQNPIVVKISGMYGAATRILSGDEEAQYGKLFGAIHLPMNMFTRFQQDPDNHYATMGHELFHVMQSEYYRFHRYLDWTGTGDYWWLEATAEYAGCREAWGENNRELDGELESGIHADFLSYSLDSTGKQPGWNREYEYASSVFIKFLVDEIGLDFKEMFEYVAEGEPFDRLDAFIREETPETWMNLETAYRQFAWWAVFSEQSFLSLYHIANFATEASYPQSEIAEAKDILQVEEDESLQFELSGDRSFSVDIFKQSEIERGADYPLDTLGLGGEDTYELDEINKGEEIYLLACQGGEGKGAATVEVQVDPEKTDDSQDSPAGEKISHTFELESYSAKVWAIKIKEAPQLEILPEVVEEAEPGEEYTFELYAQHIPQEVEEVDFVWDFGDGEEDSRNNRTGLSVERGRAEMEISREYKAGLESCTLEATVKDSSTGEELAEATARIDFGEHTVRIQGTRNLALNLEGAADEYYEYEHTFEALASPEDLNYRFEWDFDDGHTFSEEGKTSAYTHTYEDLQAGDELRPRVILKSQEGDTLAEDRILISFTREDEEIIGEVITYCRICDGDLILLDEEGNVECSGCGATDRILESHPLHPQYEER